jgi:phosphosulfolactate synthase
VVIENLEAKIKLCQSHGIDIYCGGSLFELAVRRNKVDDYIAFLKDQGIGLLEISDGVIELPTERSSTHPRLAKR